MLDRSATGTHVIFRCVIPVVFYIYITLDGFCSIQNTTKYDVFIIMLTTCFGLDNGPSSRQKTYI